MNEEQTEKKPLETSEHIVAFIDILGASEMIEHKSDETLNIIHEAYSTMMGLYKKLENIFGNSPFGIKIFSDNIVIFAPINNENDIDGENQSDLEEALFYILMVTILIQAELFNKGILVRGGITKGAFFNDPLIIWGKALVRSVYIEKEIAIYPRIVIDPDLLSQLDDISKLTKGSIIKRDTDTLYFTNYLSKEILKLANVLKNPRVYLNEKIQIYKEKYDLVKTLKVQQKLLWHRNYLESTLDEIKDIEYGETLIEQGFKRLENNIPQIEKK